MQKIEMHFTNKNCTILIGSGVLSEIGARLKQLNLGKKVVIITQAKINQLHGKVVRNSLKTAGIEYYVLEIPDGEKSKNLKVASGLLDKLAKLKIHRDDTILALGGGVVGDLAGFVASTFMRGINLVQVPTTLLSQVDSSIGGKTGVDHKAGKNLIGTFYQPSLVLSDVNVLATLPKRELISGMAEVVKYGIIRDPQILNELENNNALLSFALEGKGLSVEAEKLLVDLVARSAKIKSAVVLVDEREITGERMILNLGHTVAHALETYFNYKNLNHGEAVALGMVAEAEIAVRLNLLSIGDAARIKALLDKLGFKTALPKFPIDKITALLIMDKKVRGKAVNFVLPVKIGETRTMSGIDEGEIEFALEKIGGK